ncbi:hypothetical protein XF36_13240 [Pseudonocardia sp. HH130629-09]|nr:hypothetical protein XF36_13240 [Pseudonocardia sp. HH130629-09]
MVNRTCSRTYCDGIRSTHGTSRRMPRHSLSSRHSSGGSQDDPHSATVTRSSGSAPRASSATSDTSWDCATCPWDR